MQKLYLVMASLALVVACATHSITVDDVTGPQTWGDASNVTRIKHLYFSEQPDVQALDLAKSNGVTTVLSVRDPSELDWNEREVVENLGLKFINIPIHKEAHSIDRSAIEAIGVAVKSQQGQPILLHCSSGNRAAAWLAIHLVEDHDLDEESALAVARKAGLTKDGMENRVKSYLSGDRQ